MAPGIADHIDIVLLSQSLKVSIVNFQILSCPWVHVLMAYKMSLYLILMVFFHAPSLIGHKEFFEYFEFTFVL